MSIAVASAFAVALCAFATFNVTADDVAAPLSVPVKVLPASGNAEPEMQNAPVMRRPRPQPTTPGGKLPQYQLGHHYRTIPTKAELSNPTLRLILALPARPILIDATITIDGKPYLMAREQRIQQVLEDAAKPAPVVVAVEPEAGDESAADDASAAPEDAPAVMPEDETDSVETETAEEGKEEAAEDDPNAASDDEADPPAEEAETEEAESEEEPVTPATLPKYSLPPTVAERVRRFVAATGEEATVDEVRWMLTNWVDGPVLLMLNDNFQRFRANQRPVFNVLDSDRDGLISAGEVANSVVAFEKCDFNRNDIIEYTELAKIASDPELRESKHSGPGKLIFRIPDEKSAVAMYRRIAARYPPAEPGTQPLLPRFDVNANGKLDTEELAVLRAAKPDLSFTITFNSDDPTASRIEMTGVDSTISAASAGEGSAAESISLPIGGTTVAFSAVQSGKSDQISIGAINDGYPILPVIDPNDDGRFTIRERRKLVDSLLKFDRNLDGSLSDDETQATIRVCFGLGPQVHRELVALRQVNPKSKTPVVTGPDWFVRMDRNKDNDISSKEFSGKKEHFADLDTDGDALVSAQEALDYDRRSSDPSDTPEPSEKETTETPTKETATETE
jgi:Ca2+-binding EF-hand superfamily protein